jgi:hypothetical protein
MKGRPTRKELQQALAPALIKALSAIEFEQDATTLCRCVRALIEVAFDLAAAGSMPPSVMVVQLNRVARRRLPLLKSAPVWVMAKADA